MEKHQFIRLSDCTVRENSKFDDRFETYGKCIIRDSLLFGGRVVDSDILNSGMNYYSLAVKSTVVSQSYLGGFSLAYISILRNSIMLDKSISVRSTLDNSLMKDFSIAESAYLENAELHDSASVVRGQVRGTPDFPVILRGSTIIDRGTWTVAPLNFTSPSGISITENVGNLVTISCITNTCEKWLGGAGERYSRILGVGVDEIEFFREKVKIIARRQEVCRALGRKNTEYRY